MYLLQLCVAKKKSFSDNLWFKGLIANEGNLLFFFASKEGSN